MRQNSASRPQMSRELRVRSIGGVCLRGSTSGPGRTLREVLAAQKFIDFAEEALLFVRVFVHNSCSFHRRPAVELLAGWFEQAGGFALVRVIVSARNEQKLPGIGFQRDFLRLLDEIFVGAPRVCECCSRKTRFAARRLYQYVIDRETTFFPVWIRGSAPPPLGLIRIAISFKIHGDAVQLMTTFQDNFGWHTLAQRQLGIVFPRTHPCAERYDENGN